MNYTQSGRKNFSGIFRILLAGLVCLSSQNLSIAADGGEANKPAGFKECAAAVPAPRTDDYWEKRHKKLNRAVHSSHPEIAFFGDSITEGMNVDLLHKIISPKAGNFGIGGDRTQHLLWRFQHGELDFSKPFPKIFVVLIGTNNISNYTGFTTDSDQDIYAGVQANVNELRKRFPESKILLLAMLPRDEKPTSNIRKRVNDTNVLLKQIADNKHVWFADISKSLLEPDGLLPAKVMSDFLHPTAEEGYTRMFTAIKPYIDQIQAAK